MMTSDQPNDASAPKWAAGWNAARYLSLPQRESDSRLCAGCGNTKHFIINAKGDIHEVLVCNDCDGPLKGVS